ncbi:MAG: response regulator [Desulfobacterales bacterium]|nr:response regulator [Desulfobacterales bacterium]
MEDRLKIKELAGRVRALEQEVLALKKSGADLRAKIQSIEARPPSGGHETPMTASPAPPPSFPGSVKGRVLLMDDDGMIRELTGEKLTRLGYQATLAASGEEAVALFAKALREGRPYDAVILDLIVQQGMDGKETVRKLIDIDPDVKAIVSSGYINDPVTSNFWDYGFKAALAKPYQSGTLEKLLDTVIAENE